MEGLLKVGTNFYWIKQPEEFKNNDILIHIGKRSAAGHYCIDCGVTFCKDGIQDIHSGDSEWYDKCPICGGEGTYVTSFTWTAMKQKEVINRLIGSNKKLIEDEYGERYTPKEFLFDELANSKVEYQVYDYFS